MFTRMHDRLGTAGLVVAIVALVAALSGAAYAANGGLSGKQKKEVEKIAKKYAGKAGAPGKDGAPGPAGTKGDTGAAGSKGDKGDKGEQGTQGLRGPKGDPWVPDNELPPGATLTGTWAVGPSRTAGFVRAAISFSIPLAAALDGTGCDTDPPASTCHVHYLNASNEEVLTGVVKATAPSVHCTGSASAPTADPGHLCIYTGNEFELEMSNVAINRVDGSPGASTTGAVMQARIVEEFGSGQGSWAVRAEL